MSKNLYIDASHPNETRVVLKSNNHIEDYEYESINNTLIKNNIYLGEGSYGIASASLRYFNKPISELNYGEAALLAALPKLSLIHI